MVYTRRFDFPTWGWRSAFEEMDRMKKDMDRLLGGLSGRYFPASRSGVFPMLNLTEDKDRYYVRAELPGVSPEALEIHVTGKNLSIAGERKISAENAKYHRREREAGKFSRIIGLPGNVDGDKIEARLTDGILTVIIPKAEAEKPRQIQVK
jgi:HSP20 family protein